MPYANIKYDVINRELIIVVSDTVAKSITFPIRNIFEIEFLSGKVEYLENIEDSDGKLHKEVRRHTLSIPEEKEFLVNLYFDTWKQKFIGDITDSIESSDN